MGLVKYLIFIFCNVSNVSVVVSAVITTIGMWILLSLRILITSKPLISSKNKSNKKYHNP